MDTVMNRCKDTEELLRVACKRCLDYASLDMTVFLEAF